MWDVHCFPSRDAGLSHERQTGDKPYVASGQMTCFVIAFPVEARLHAFPPVRFLHWSLCYVSQLLGVKLGCLNPMVGGDGLHREAVRSSYRAPSGLLLKEITFRKETGLTLFFSSSLE